MGGTPGHKYRKSKEPKEPKKTQEQASLEMRQRSLLDKEIEEEEERLRMLSRGKLGSKSLLSGAPRNPMESASGSRRGGGGGAGSLLSSGGPKGGAPRERAGSTSAPKFGNRN